MTFVKFIKGDLLSKVLEAGGMGEGKGERRDGGWWRDDGMR
jgi:hypothetical protein